MSAKGNMTLVLLNEAVLQAEELTLSLVKGLKTSSKSSEGNNQKKRNHWVLNLMSKPALLFWMLVSSCCLAVVDVKW